MKRSLSRAIASDEYRDKMDVEDEIDRIFERELGKIDIVIAQKDKLLNKSEKRYDRSGKATGVLVEGCHDVCSVVCFDGCRLGKLYFSHYRYATNCNS